jgi:putative spermidine/putrescine transport system ATP-binding protein
MDSTLWECEQVTKTYGSVHALCSIHFSINKQEFLTITGPSGSGKTTLLTIIAGLVQQDSGTIHRTPGLHPILVFQDFQLFPGMTVEGNIEFGLKAQKMPKDQRIQTISQLLHDFDLTRQKHQYPSQLSAGQQQRTALARALAVNPQLLLLDEPFAHLDRELKHSTALYLRELHDRYNITTLMVTHDQEEAMAVSTRIVHLSGGKILQSGSPEDLLYKPNSMETALFFGELNTLIDPQSGQQLYTRPQDNQLLHPRLANSPTSTHLHGRIIKKSVHPLGFRYELDHQGTTITSLTAKSDAQVGETWAFEVNRRLSITNSKKSFEAPSSNHKEAIA